MLESIGFEEADDAGAGRPDPVQHVLDPRAGRQPLPVAPGRGQAPEGRAAGPRRRGRGVLGAVGQGGGLPAVSVRRRGLRAGPGPQAGGVPGQRLADLAGLLRVRGLHRPPAGQARAAVPGVDADLGRVQLGLQLLHRPVDPGREVSRPPGELVAEAERLAADGVREVTLLARTSTRTGATCAGGAHELRPPARADRRRGRIERIRYTSPHPKDMREDVVLAHARTARASASTSTCPLQSGSSAVLKRMRRTYTRERYLDRRGPDPRARARLRPDHGRHRRASPGRRRRTSPRPCGGRVGRYDGAFTFVFSPRRGRRPATFTEGSCRTRSRSSGWGAWSRSCSARPTRGRSALSGAARGARRGPVADRPGAPARTDAAQQGGQLHRYGPSRASSSTWRSSARRARP